MSYSTSCITFHATFFSFSFLVSLPPFFFIWACSFYLLGPEFKRDNLGVIAITDSKLPDGLSVQFPCTRYTNINDPFLTFVLHGDLYFKRIYVHHNKHDIVCILLS